MEADKVLLPYSISRYLSRYWINSKITLFSVQITDLQFRFHLGGDNELTYSEVLRLQVFAAADLSISAHMTATYVV